MEGLIVGIFTVISFVLGYRMGKGETIELPKKLKFAIRNDAQEKALVDKLEAQRKK